MKQKLARFDITNIKVIESPDKLTVIEMIDSQGRSYRGVIETSFDQGFIIRQLCYFNGVAHEEWDIFDIFQKWLD